MLMGRAVCRRASTGDRSPRQQLRKVRDTRAREGGRERGAEGGKEEETFAVFFAAVSCLEEGKGREGSGGQREGMYVQDLNEGADRRDRGAWPARACVCGVACVWLADVATRRAQDDKEFDFDGQGSSDPVGAGWGMDDLDSMLLKGMQKKRRQRAAGLVAVIIVRAHSKSPCYLCQLPCGLLSRRLLAWCRCAS